MLATAVPPGDALKPLESRTMTASNYFADIDFEKSKLSNQLFSQEHDIEIPGSILRLDEYSLMVYVIKKMDLSNGELSDYGFAL